MDVVKLVAVFILIVIGLRKKISVGLTLLVAGVVTALIYRVPMLDLLNGYWELLQSSKFIFLTSVVLLITFLGSLLKGLGHLERLSAACRGLIGGNRTAAAVMPPLVGLMPMPGGSLLSAPLVGNVLTDSKYTPEFKTATNYWMRHFVEFFWPVYPGVILTEAITGMPIIDVSLMQVSVSMIMLALGLTFFIRKIDPGENSRANLGSSLWRILTSVWPIVLAIVLYSIPRIFGLVRIELAWAVLFSIVLLIVTSRPSKKVLKSAAKDGFSYKLILLVFGTLSFQTALELSGAIEAIPRLSASLNLPPELVIFLVCFTSGILTGMVAAYVALSYTILAGFLYGSGLQPGYVLLAYVSGFVGMMLSPTHLCLILTNEYFGSDLGKVYRLLIWPAILLGLGGFVVYLTGYPNLFRP
ncbi:MAG TPA: DUF401 family protein [candidate division Zixibacteria bacterium]|nr:DUF401 family protein [candidate division Zixibacteria bacterium]